MLIEIYKGLLYGLVDDLLEVDNQAVVIKNPTVTFNEMYKAGHMDKIPVDMYDKFLDYIEDLSKLWCSQPVLPLMSIAITIYRHSFIMKEDYKSFLTHFIAELNGWWMTINDIKMMNLKSHGVDIGEVAGKAFDKFKTGGDLMEDFYDFALNEKDIDYDPMGLKDFEETNNEDLPEDLKKKNKL